MAGSLLDVARARLGTPIDPDSTGGRVLAALTPRADFDAATGTSGVADGALRFAPTADGIVLDPPGAGLLTLGVPASAPFRLVEDGPPRVEIVLVEPTLPLPFLRPAAERADGWLEEAPGDVELRLPELLLVVRAEPAAQARLAPATGAAGTLEARIDPALVLVGPGRVLGLELPGLALRLDGAGAPELTAPSVRLLVSPPGISGLAARGAATGLRLGLGATDGGLSGRFAISSEAGAEAVMPSFLESVAVEVRIERNAVTLLELSGRLDLTGELERRLGAGTRLADAGAPLSYRLRLALTDGWDGSLTLEPAVAQGWIWRTRRAAPGPEDLVGNALGAYAVLGPLLASSLPTAGGDGLVELGLVAGSAAALGTSGVVVTDSLTLLGADLRLRAPAAGDATAALLLDLEAEIELRLGGLLRPRRPLAVRQRGLGLRLDLADGALRPVFDPSRGLSLDLSDPGTFELPAPLGDLLQADGAHAARDNPLSIEIGLVPKADLGIVSLERATVRAAVIPPGPPSITGLAARLDTGALRGAGYLHVDEDAVAGGLDVALAPPLGIRVRSDLRIGDAPGIDAPSVLAGFDVEWPVPVPLANSGLGLFGVLGLLGVHVERDAGDPLGWLVAAGGNPAAGAWHGSADGWALGLGAVIGTVEGGFLVHAKGMVMLELPGPRLLLAMRADLLRPRPPKQGPDTGTLLAVIEMRPDSITIGVVAEYRIPFLLEVRVPAEARFDLVHPERWSLDIGAIPESPPPALPASVRFMSALRADGYLLLHGDGIPDFPLRPLAGLAVAAGIRAALTWGPEAIGLYLRVAARADVGLGFQPFTIIGKLTLEGELHLFVISVSASASARLVIADGSFFVEAEVCGEVDFFLFEVHGCVVFRLGDERVAPPPAAPLVRGVSLHSRTPALLPGSGSDRPVDGSLASAARPDAATLPVVPIDAIPVVELEMRPHVDGAAFLGTPVPSLLEATDWVRRGERLYRYTLRAIELTGGGPGGPVDDGDRPVVWWDRRGLPAPGDDTQVQLALLSWIPDPTPAAAERTRTRDREVERRFGSVCAEAAAPAPVLWSLAGATAGPSPGGWSLRGAPLPDEPGRVRSAPAPDRLVVTEPWRTGDAIVDGLVDAVPGHVLAHPRADARVLVAPRAARPPRLRLDGDGLLEELVQGRPRTSDETLADALRLRADGWQRLRALLFATEGRTDLVVRGLDEDGRSTGLALTPGLRSIGSLGDLPPDWGRRPWSDVVERTLDAWFPVFQESLAGLLTFLELDLPGVPVVELGFESASSVPWPPWGLLLVEGSGEGERVRFAFDRERQRTRVATVDGALGADPGRRALLRPGATYELAVTYDVATADADETGAPRPVGPPEVGRTERFAFRTDARAPASIEPWVLATSPADGDHATFYEEPVRVAFATGAARRLFAAYGKTLFAVVRAASGRHPRGGDGFDPAEVDLAATLAPITIVPSLVTTPFAGALEAVAAGLPCIDLSTQHSAHEVVTLTLALEPSTEHVLDLEARPVEERLHPLLRRHFTTSRYPSAAAFALDVLTTPVAHRGLSGQASFGRLAAATGEISGLELELGLREARWGELGAPDRPRVTAVWIGDQPRALLIETTEPHWRAQAVPELVDPADPDGPRRFALVERPSLAPVVAGGGAAVERLVRTSDGARTLVLLAPGARGSVVQLALVRTPHPLFEVGAAPAAFAFADVDLARPPWEA